MGFRTPYLHKINHTTEAPNDEVYIFYDLKGGIYWMNTNDYPDFAIQWAGASKIPSLTMDLAAAGIHSIILDFDYQPKNCPENKNIGRVVDSIDSVLKMIFLPSVPNFTYIVALRPQSKGLHIHLPEFKIGHDDYILFCESLQHKFKHAMRGNNDYKLDILTNAMLPGAAKPDTYPYMPSRLVYVDERTTFTYNVVSKEDLQNLKKKFTKRKDNENSIFRILLNCNPSMLAGELKLLMMPVVLRTQIYCLTYATSIGHLTATNSSDSQDVASYTCKKTKNQVFISKSKKLDFGNTNNLLKVYHHLKFNAPGTIDFETNNHAIKMWYEHFLVKSINGVNDSHIPPLFRELNQTLQLEHSTLAENPNPIKTVMQFKEGYYFLPVFYALCKHYNIDSSSMAQELYPLIDTSFHYLLDKIRVFNPQNIQYAITEISINTLHFCANNLEKRQPKNNREKLKSIVENNRRIILSVTTQDQMEDALRRICDRKPLKAFRPRQSSLLPGRYSS